jgi:hypothetical protein
LAAWQGNAQRSIFMTRHTLCKTLAGNTVEYVTITDPAFDCSENSVAYLQDLPSHFSEEQRPWIVVCGRVHPSESNSSWFVHGLIEYLTDPHNSTAEQLRRQFVWLVVPMINPDGVICGNSRCNLAGLDLNRCWTHPSEGSCPTIFHVKALLKRLCSMSSIVLFLDVHGHSRKKGAFVYGNRKQHRSPSGQLMPFASAPVGPEVKIPELLAAHSNIFSLEDCRYSIDRSKLSTARCVIFNEFQLANSFTLEISMFTSVSLCDSSTTAAPLHFTNASASRVLSVRDAVDSSSVSELSSGHSIPEHLEIDHFMQLSRDFATCLIVQGLSWTIDAHGFIMKMQIPSVTHSVTGEDDCSSFQDGAASTRFRRHIIQWLDKRGITISVESEIPLELRSLSECKSIRAVDGIDIESFMLPLPPADPKCAKLLKLLLDSVKVHRELQFETLNMRASVQSFMLHQLRQHIKQTTAVQVQSTLRAVADWINFVIKFHRKVDPEVIDRGICEAGFGSRTTHSSAFAAAVDFAALALVQRRIIDALDKLNLQRGFHLARGSICSAGDETLSEIHHHQSIEVKGDLQDSFDDARLSTKSLEPAGIHLDETFTSQPTNVQVPADNLPLSSFSEAATSRMDAQHVENCIKPWSLSFTAPDTLHSNRRLLDGPNSSRVSGVLPSGSRMRYALTPALSFFKAFKKFFMTFLRLH